MTTAKLIVKKDMDKNGFPITKITHIKVMKDGKYFKFAKHTDELINAIQAQDFTISEKVVK